jgi:hypothetical protein
LNSEIWTIIDSIYRIQMNPENLQSFRDAVRRELEEYVDDLTECLVKQTASDEISDYVERIVEISKTDRDGSFAQILEANTGINPFDWEGGWIRDYINDQTDWYIIFDEMQDSDFIEDDDPIDH